MDRTKPRHLLRKEYDEAAQAYLHSLPLEHFAQAVPQATQCHVTLSSMSLVHYRRPDIQTFSELLVQYPLDDQNQKGQVVPDNMVVVWPQPIQANLSYDLPLQPAPWATVVPLARSVADQTRHEWARRYLAR